MIELQTSVKQDDTTRTRTPKPGYLNLSIKGYRSRCIPKVVGSNPTVARHIFLACPVWIYTQSNITQANQRNCLHFGLSQSECVKRLHHMIEICINVAIYIQIHYTYRAFFQFCWYIKMGLIN
jgi:hypothetical protein